MSSIEFSATVDSVEYVGTYDTDTSQVTLSQSVDPLTGATDGHAYSVGSGRWDGESIVDCGADLGDEVYDALDEALSDALADAS